jgi:hypothetical protein
VKGTEKKILVNFLPDIVLLGSGFETIKVDKGFIWRHPQVHYRKRY